LSSKFDYLDEMKRLMRMPIIDEAAVRYAFGREEPPPFEVGQRVISEGRAGTIGAAGRHFSRIELDDGRVDDVDNEKIRVIR
jgi:hypothetical protein